MILSIGRIPAFAAGLPTMEDNDQFVLTKSDHQAHPGKTTIDTHSEFTVKFFR